MSAMQANVTHDPCRCPLCGNPNSCAFAENPGVQHCWCIDVTFPPTLLEQVRCDDRHRCCICHECVLAANLNTPDPE